MINNFKFKCKHNNFLRSSLSDLNSFKYVQTLQKVEHDKDFWEQILKIG